MFVELIDRKIEDVESVANRHGSIAVTVCCLDLHDLVVEIWVEEAMLLTMKVPYINFEGVRNRIVLFSALLQATGVIKNKGIGVTATMHYRQSDSENGMWN